MTPSKESLVQALREPKTLIALISVPVAVLLDQLTKIWAILTLRPLLDNAEPTGRFLTVVEGFFRMKYTENPGAAWGLLRSASPEWRVPFFIITSLVAIVAFVWFYRKIEREQKWLATAISFIMGGALGNLIDRIRMGRVVDFVDWFVSLDRPLNLGFMTIEAGEKHWPTFNVADAFITAGVIMFILEMMLFAPKKSEALE